MKRISILLAVLFVFMFTTSCANNNVSSEFQVNNVFPISNYEYKFTGVVINGSFSIGDTVFLLDNEENILAEMAIEKLDRPRGDETTTYKGEPAGLIFTFENIDFEIEKVSKITLT